MFFVYRVRVLLFLLVCVLPHLGCDGQRSDDLVVVDGSSTVFPISEAVADEFSKTHDAKLIIGTSGTGGGFKKFCKSEIDIAAASRPIRPIEVEKCEAAGVEYIELPVAYDGIAIVVHPDNNWVNAMTVDELRRLWRAQAQGEITHWSQIRPDWPEQEIHLFGPGVDSGTYDYFTKAIIGEEHSSRGDFTSSEDDNVLVTGIARDSLALGFFGFAYYDEHRDKLKALGIDDGNPQTGPGPIWPSRETIREGTYQPLTRPIFIYVRKAAAERPEVQSFIDYYLNHAGPLAEEVGYISLPHRAYALAEERFDRRVTHSVFEGGGSEVGVRVEDLLVEQKQY